MTRMDTAHGASRAGRGLGRLTGPVFESATYASWGYLLVGLPLGVLWFSLLFSLYVTGTVLIVVWIGIGLLALVQVLSREIGLFERWLAQSWLGAAIPEPEPVGGGTLVERGRAHLTDEFAWRTLLWSFLRLISGIVGFVIAVVAFVVPLSLTVAPVSYVWGVPPQAWEWTLWVAPIVGIPAFFGAAHLIKALGRGNARLAELVLGTSSPAAVEEAAQRAERAEEQLRIDQELHDSIGHVLTMNVVQAGAGAHVFDQDPEFAREALENIERRGREALDELDRIIGLVRSEGFERKPLPDLDDIPGLVEEIREAGMEIDGAFEPPQTTPEVGRAAYRLVQEALTNVAKHAPGAATSVLIGGTDGWLEVDVVNSAPSISSQVASPSGTGSGLNAIHQRVAILGGQSEAGPTPDGGFRVHAVLPGIDVTA